MNKINLSDAAYEYIKDKIINCVYLPNSVINEKMICDEINSSRTPVRHAISKLEQENLVIVLPKKGILVKDVTLDDIRLIYETRLLIEPYAIRVYGPGMDKKYLKAYLENLKKIDDTEVGFEEDDKLHYFIVSQTRNVYLINIINSIYSHNMRLRILSGRNLEGRISDTIGEHNEIIHKLINEDYEGAARSLIKHLEISRDTAYRIMLNKLRINTDMI